MKQLNEKAKQIKLLIIDVDGVLTAGHLVYSEHGLTLKAFHVHDGLGLQLLKKSGVKIAAITTCVAKLNQTRLEGLGFDDIFLGQKDKRAAFAKLSEKYQLNDEQIAYMGDDLPDLALIRKAGLGVIPANAISTLKSYADMQTVKRGGEGAVRELCEFIMQAQNTFDDIIATYLS
ncbi:MAG: HAD hydrolase family protein [Gammaproteobacteria bacterium]|jgi:3-deoxy-D-manno-octulosonate 8-phosphate phosphatase (KDO 8-P phosphatase)